MGKALAMSRETPLGLDAGALCALQPRGRPGRPLVITPHAGEMARLLQRDKADIEADPLAAARQAAQAKSSVVASPEGPSQIDGLTKRAPSRC